MSLRTILKRMTCALLDHSKIVETCLGYVHCARCGELLGDTIGGVFEPKVIVGHNCEKCREGYLSLTWKDKLFVKNPLFESEANQMWRKAKESGRSIFDLIKEKRT